MLLTLGHIARSITSMHDPPMLACTPYQILPDVTPKQTRTLHMGNATHHAMTPRLKVHHKLPYRPKLVLATTGNVMW